MASQEREESTFVACPICFDGIDLDDPTEICSTCTQKYHRNCILQWLKKWSHCPYCRANMNELRNLLRLPNQTMQQTAQNNAINNYDLMNDDETALEEDFGVTCPCS
ncbi:unnamed protein product [Adineta ricciae]|uniref:RING-type domain-containing protein n=1 Tax=Adineta ricciae TaxID=249248 RepID=A0A815B803_ADIRI|nr:unnamed protein product [Adineta ricciae]